MPKNKKKTPAKPVEESWSANVSPRRTCAASTPRRWRSRSIASSATPWGARDGGARHGEHGRREEAPGLIERVNEILTSFPDSREVRMRARRS